MSLPRDIVPAGHVANATDPPSKPVAQPHQPSQDNMEGGQFVQWLSAQAGNMAGDLQHNVRVLMLRVSSPMPVSDGHDEVASLRKQLRQQQSHREMQTMLKNQALAIETCQSKWHMAGQAAHAFIARIRSQSEDFARAELMAVQRFEDNLQRQYDGQLRTHVNALQEECRDHVGQEEDELRKELQQTLSTYRDQLQQTLRHQVCQEEHADAESTREMGQLRRLISEQTEAIMRVEAHSQHLISQQQEAYAHYSPWLWHHAHLHWGQTKVGRF